MREYGEGKLEEEKKGEVESYVVEIWIEFRIAIARLRKLGVVDLHLEYKI